MTPTNCAGCLKSEAEVTRLTAELARMKDVVQAARDLRMMAQVIRQLEPDSEVIYLDHENIQSLEKAVDALAALKKDQKGEKPTVCDCGLSDCRFCEEGTP